jgi:hypothetical protein
LNGNAPDWCLPWFAPLQAQGKAVWQRAQVLPVAQALQQANPGPQPRFVPQDDLPEGGAYETHVFQTGRVPTRDNPHDLFNGLVWLGYPQAKARVNELQAAQIVRDGVRPVRGPVRDALTLLDENGALLLASAPIWQALRERQWRTLFVDLRPAWQQARLLIFGHALLEKLLNPRKDLTAHVYLPRQPMPHAGQGAQALDAWLARDLTPGYLAGKPFTPLPVLGVPGWWAESENFSFYDDSLVFRPRRTP